MVQNIGKILTLPQAAVEEEGTAQYFQEYCWFFRHFDVL
jgi:hypothetical protein